MRLNAALVRAGLATSRRKADKLINAGAVSYNDKTITVHATNVKDGDRLRIGRKEMVFHTNVNSQMVLFYKPVGYVCSHSPQSGQKSIFELLPRKYSNYKLAGRLDIDSEGLLVLSRDGKLINELTHPGHSNKKTYLITTKEAIKPTQMQKLNSEFVINNTTIVAKSVRQLSTNKLEIVISQGLNRQIRKMVGHVGLSVEKLIRISIGPYKLGSLKPGQWLQVK